MSIKWNFKKHSIFSLFIIVIAFISNLIFGLLSQFAVDRILKSNSGVAIIGGADGPTSIYVSNNGLIDWWPFPSYVIFLVLLIALYIPIKIMIIAKERSSIS